MGLMNWLLKGIGFEDEEDDEAEAIRLENKAKKQKLKEAKRKQKEADRLGRTNAKLQEYEKPQEETQEQQPAAKDAFDQFNFSASNRTTTEGSDNLGGYNTDLTNGYNNDIAPSVGGYGSKNVVFFYPKSYTEAQKLINYLKQGESVMLNLDDVSDAEAQRMLDFASGAIYAVNGSIQRVSGNIFLLTPEGLNIIPGK